eukprot:6360030-Pyramimonas_sp.AAC.1
MRGLARTPEHCTWRSYTRRSWMAQSVGIGSAGACGVVQGLAPSILADGRLPRPLSGARPLLARR